MLDHQTNRTEASDRVQEMPVDADAALKRLGGDVRLLRDLIGFFLEDAPGLLEMLDSSLGSGDLDEAARAAHTLKGSAANFGAEAAVTSAAAVERAARQSDLDRAKELSAELHQNIESLQHELQTLKF